MSSSDASTFATPARLRLAAATRHLVDAVLTTEDATDRALDDAADATERTVADLRGRAVDAGARPGGERSRHERRQEDYLPRSPLVGSVNPVAPPLAYEFHDDHVIAHGCFGAAYEGPPGYVHGGWVALAFDEALGMANAISGHPGMTARLTVRYRKPTPLGTELHLHARTARIDGRRITTAATLRAGDTVTAEAEGLFVVIGAERALEYFGERSSTPEPADPLP
ncbi:MAG: PaaI family thioesterase [Acidimicrobiia bacterium]|nr:PaaI family thioesterase [Acidimicrobiia bacterium]